MATPGEKAGWSIAIAILLTFMIVMFLNHKDAAKAPEKVAAKSGFDSWQIDGGVSAPWSHLAREQTGGHGCWNGIVTHRGGRGGQHGVFIDMTNG